MQLDLWIVTMEIHGSLRVDGMVDLSSKLLPDPAK